MPDCHNTEYASFYTIINVDEAMRRAVHVGIEEKRK